MKNQKGITLIALVITIIILLILAAISINALTGENGLIAKAKQAKQNTIDSANKENSILSEMEGKIAEGLNEKINVGKEKLTIENRKIVSSESKAEFKMKGIAIAQVFSFNEERTSTETLQLLKEDGFNTIRYQLPASMFYNFDTDTWEDSNIEKLKDFCKRAQEVGMYIIVDMHALESGQLHFRKVGEYCVVSEDGSVYEEQFIKVWGKLAEELKDYKSVLAYELMNEPAAMWHTSQEMALQKYSELMQKCIEEIRKIDKDTIISFQQINVYINTSYNWTETVVDKFPKLNGENLLCDSFHSYDKCLFEQPYGVINMTQVNDAGLKEKKWYAGSKYTENLDQLNTYSVEVEADELAKKVVYVGLIATNCTGATSVVDSYRIYKINDDGTENEVLNLKSTDDPKKIKIYDFSDILGVEKEIPKDTYFILPDSYSTKLLIGLLPHEKIRIEIDAKIMNYDKSKSVKASIRYGSCEVENNDKGENLVTGYRKLEELIKYYDNISKNYNSPLYWGEFCVIDQYINGYTKYKEYTDAFAELTDKYHLNWIWHRMSEYPSDSSGYGAYVGNVKPINKRTSMWEYIIPRILK